MTYVPFCDEIVLFFLTSLNSAARTTDVRSEERVDSAFPQRLARPRPRPGCAKVGRTFNVVLDDKVKFTKKEGKVLRC